MKISLQWLRNYVDIQETTDSIEAALNQVGLEVEGVETAGVPKLDKVVVGEVLTKEQHPDADKLSVCSVRVSNEDEPLQIVCGAKNFVVGDRVPVATVGAVLPGDFKISKGKLRGVESFGMMCSAKELNMGDDHSGLLILEDKPEIGTPINDVLPEGDIVFDVSITPNRPDCLSHVGIARELAAYFGLEFNYPFVEPERFHKSADDAQRALLEEVNVENEELCPYYRAYSISGVKIAPSPEWLKTALLAIGLRPINNVVDVTNYVLHELGQPLHAFDAYKIRGRQINVRLAKEGEKITTLDDKERELTDRMLVIADSEKPMVIAGVMGSVDAEVEEKTTDIVLEAAVFNSSSVRWTARRLGLSTDSSYRFERGVDPKGVEFAAWRAIQLILETAGGELDKGEIVVGEPPVTEAAIEITPDYIRRKIGFEVTDEKIKEVLESLEMEMQGHERQGEKYWEVSIPSYRLDLGRPIDLVEEFLRMYGTENIPSAPVEVTGGHRSDDATSIFTSKAANVFIGERFMECINYSTRSSEELELWFGKTAAAKLGLDNPLLSDQTHLRPSLLPGLLDNLKLNKARLNDAERLFEIGHCFREKNGDVHELISVAFLIVQDPRPTSWKEREKPDFYTAKSYVEQVLELAGVSAKKLKFAKAEHPDVWQQGHSASAGDYAQMGWEVRCGLLNQILLKQWDISGTVLAGAIYVKPETLARRKSKLPFFQAFSQFPPTARDLALVVDADTPAESVRKNLEKVATKAAGKLFAVEKVEVFDVYQGKGLEEGKKSLALSMTFRSSDNTLEDKQVAPVFDTIQKQITEGTGYQLRS